MISTVKDILSHNNAINYTEQGITIARVSLINDGFRLAKNILNTIVDRKTVLYLSGGSMKDLYVHLVNEKKLTPGALALIDERYGSKSHNNSNEKMIRDTGLLPYASSQNIPFYPILQDPQQDLVTTSDNYDMTLRYLFSGFPKSVGLLGMGTDGHTAGIAGNRPESLGEEGYTNPIFNNENKSNFVSSFSDLTGPFKERVTMTFLGLSMLDVFLVLFFGESKKNAFKKVFEDGSEEDVPARFFKRPDIAKRTLFITDQKI